MTRQEDGYSETASAACKSHVPDRKLMRGTSRVLPQPHVTNQVFLGGRPPTENSPAAGLGTIGT